MTYGKIHSIETFGTVDGPGIRFVIFFQGCPMRCKYCHNPDTWTVEGGTLMTVDEILKSYKKNRVFYKNGGITATGGEPLLQLDFLTQLFQKAKEEGIHTCLDTSGIMFSYERQTEFKKLVQATDYVLLDVKHIRKEEHMELTGQDNQPVFDFLSFLENEQISVRIRHVLVPGITTASKDLIALGKALSCYKNINEFELLPYHTMGTTKYDKLAIPYPLKGIREPSKEEVREARKAILVGFHS
ncbi:MAG: pyruvate formate-lyase-activating protein [Velocimicrobium sp.]